MEANGNWWWIICRWICNNKTNTCLGIKLLDKMRHIDRRDGSGFPMIPDSHIHGPEEIYGPTESREDPKTWKSEELWRRLVYQSQNWKDLGRSDWLDRLTGGSPEYILPTVRKSQLGSSVTPDSCGVQAFHFNQSHCLNEVKSFRGSRQTGEHES